jgi:DNA-binding NarL/FixJ family response regulator
MLTDPPNFGPSRVKIIRLIAEGNTNREIADKIGLSQNTVKVYIDDIMQELDARNRANIVYESMRLKIIDS